jgi:glycosyltransferase involved in cell wall biosynthesis
MAPVARQIESLRALGVQVDVLEVRGLPGLKYLQTLPSFWRKVGSADLVHAHFGYPGWIARLQVTRPLVVSFMGSDLLGVSDQQGRSRAYSRVVVQMNRLLARGIDAAIVKSEEMARVIAPVRAHVIPNGVDLELFRPLDMAEARAALGLRQDGRYVLFPGNPGNPRKGYPVAREAVSKASALLGESLEMVPLSRVTPDQVPLFMNACDAMLLTSFWEGSPNVVKEAMACNRPIVAVPVGDVTELLSGVHGCAVGPRDSDALARLLVDILAASPESDGRLAVVRKGLDLKSVAEKVTRVYEEVLGRRSGEARAAA